MTTGSKKLKRANHTVNKSYLRRFADEDGLLTRVELPGDKRIPISINRATVIKNFYVLELPDGTESDEAEDVFSDVEAKATAAISALLDQRVWPIPALVRENVSRWVALQYLRGPWVRQLGREIAEGFSNVGVPVKTGAGQQINVKMPPEVIGDLTGPRLQLELIERQLSSITGMLCDRRWILTFYERKTLATSDAPVVLCPGARARVNEGVGVGNADEVHVPLDRRAALSMSEGRPGDVRMHGVAKTARYLNDAIAKNARKYLFHHPKDDPLRGLELPQPRRHELASPAEAGELIRDYFG